MINSSSALIGLFLLAGTVTTFAKSAIPVDGDPVTAETHESKRGEITGEEDDPEYGVTRYRVWTKHYELYAGEHAEEESLESRVFKVGLQST